jgi:hypothetical protein
MAASITLGGVRYNDFWTGHFSTIPLTEWRVRIARQPEHIRGQSSGSQAMASMGGKPARRILSDLSLRHGAGD